MKIVFVGPFGLQPKATMRTRALLLAKALVRRGHRVTLLIPPWDDPGRAGQTWEDDGVRVVNLALPWRIPLVFHLGLAVSLVAQTLALRPDVIHFFKPKAYAGLAHLIIWTLRGLGLVSRSIRLALDADDWEQAWNELLPYSRLHKRFFSWQENWGLRQADLVTTASRALEQLALAQRSAESAGVYYVPNGYLPAAPDDGAAPIGLTAQAVREQWRLGSAPTILLYSRFVEFRLERIVRLVQRITAIMPEARWLIVGRGLQGQEQLLAEQLAGAGLSQYVSFTGWPVEGLPAYFEASNVAVFPYDDTLINRTKCSVKLLDLLPAGLPVVADAVGQNCEYIQHNVTGVLVPPQDETAFVEALVDLLQDPAKQRRLGGAAKQHIQERYNWFFLSQTVERAYDCAN